MHFFPLKCNGWILTNFCLKEKYSLPRWEWEGHVAKCTRYLSENRRKIRGNTSFREETGLLPCSFSDVSITWIPKPHSRDERRKSQVSFLHEQRCKNPHQTFKILPTNQTIYEKNHNRDQAEYSMYTRLENYKKN